jgi:hypothetical protein
MTIFNWPDATRLPPRWPPRPRWLFIGVEIGQKRRASAIAVVETETRFEGPAWPYRERTHFLVRHLDRLPPGTTYHGVACRLADVCRGVAVQENRKPVVFANATGLGAPVIDLLKAEASHAERIWTVYFNHGDRRSEEQLADLVTLGKGYLVSQLQALLQGDQLHLPQTPQADTLARELREYEIRITEDANDRYGAFRVGTHDDLVNALGLAVQIDRIESQCSVFRVWERPGS